MGFILTAFVSVKHGVHVYSTVGVLLTGRMAFSFSDGVEHISTL